MKLKRGKTYQGLFLSDVHYLLDKRIKPHHHKELFRLLDRLARRKIKFVTICLGGDIIENWFFDGVEMIQRNEKRFSKLFDRLDAIGASGGRKIYIVGNHDTTAFTMKLHRDVERRLLQRGWEIAEQASGDGWTAIHGHQGQYNRLTWALNVFGLRLLHLMGLLSPRAFRFAERFYDSHLNRQDPATPEEELHFYRKLSRISRQRDRILICGHTHTPLCLPELRLLNSGDWLEHRSFLLQKKRRFYGVRIAANREWQELFHLDYKPDSQEGHGEEEV
ncbi:MAG: metallophosphoesterase [Leptospirales bacterium]|nr:metallophosphoesterase [Leptospirales bacterium]